VNGAVIVTGASGQDARLLIPELVARGCTVHALTRRGEVVQSLYGRDGSVVVREVDLLRRAVEAAAYVADVQPAVVFNLTGVSSVSQSFAQPALAWQLNAEWVAMLLEALRTRTPATRLYQASSSEMFGCLPGESVVHDEQSPLRPQSPYAASKAAAHLMCGVYRSSFGVRTMCGILFNHESRYRGEAFLTTKIARHVAAVRSLAAAERAAHPPLRVGRLDVQRDWGYAPEYIDGILRIADQIAVRNERSAEKLDDVAANYRDYVLGTGVLTSVRELIDRAFALAGLPLQWTLDEPGRGFAVFADTGTVAVESVPEFYRAAEPKAIQADASRARRELGWSPTASVDVFLRDMLHDEGEAH